MALLCFCGKPLPEVWFFAQWCDDCLDERMETGEDAKAFIARKKAEVARG